MKRMTSRKSHSWWWDSHISPKNSRWLFENLEQMDRLIKEMLKLIEEEGDTFAKKAEMYYQRRPKLLAHVEDFYRMYRALAERYDNVTGELRKNMPTDLQSQSSGNGSDFGTDSAVSPSFSPSPDQTPKRKKNHPKSLRRAAGFDVFLGSAASSDYSRKDSDDSPSSSSSSETGSDSEVGKVVDADDNTSGLNARIIQLEEELREARGKLNECKSGFNGQCDHLMSMNEHQEQDDKMGHESENKTVILEGEIRRLMEAMDVAAKKFEDEISFKDHTIEEYKAQIDATLSRLMDEKSILEVELNSSISDLKLEAKKLSEKKTILEIGIMEQEQRIGDMKSSAEISERLLHENSMPESKVCSVMDSENIHVAKHEALENRVRELEAEKCEKCNVSFKVPAQQLNQSIDGDELKVDMLTDSEKDEFNVITSRLMDSENILKAEIQALGNRVTDSEAEKAETCNECNESAKLIAELNKCLNVYKLKVQVLTSEKDDLNARVSKILDLKHIHEAKIQALENQLKELEAAMAEECNKSVKSIAELNQSMDIYKLRVDMLTSENNQVRELEAAKAGVCNETSKHIHELYQSLDRYKLKVDKLTSEKDEVNAIVSGLIESKCIHDADVQVLENRVRELEAAKDEAFNENAKHIDELNQSLDRYKLKVDMLLFEKDELNARMSKLMDDAKCWDANSCNVAEHLHHLHMEHVNLIKEIEEAREISIGLMNRVQELEEEVEKQRVLILDGAEEKREAIRQLCFSLEHYRDGYQKLRQMLQGHSRRLAIMAA